MGEARRGGGGRLASPLLVCVRTAAAGPGLAWNAGAGCAPGLLWKLAEPDAEASAAAVAATLSGFSHAHPASGINWTRRAERTGALR